MCNSYVGRNLLHTTLQKNIRKKSQIHQKSATFAMPESNCGVVLFLSVIHT